MLLTQLVSELDIIAVLKHHDQNQLGGGRYFPYTSTLLSIIKGSQDRNLNRAGTWRQELRQKPWVLPPGLLSMV